MLGKCKLRFSEPTHLSGLSPVPMRSFKKAPMHREAAVWNVPATLLLAWQNTNVQVLPWCARQTGSWEMSFLIPLQSGLGESFNSWKPVLSPAVLGIWPRGWYYSPQTRKLFFLLAQLPYLWFSSLGSPDAHLTASQTENEWGSSVLNFNSADAFPADVLISSWISSPLVHGN